MLSLMRMGQGGVNHLSTNFTEKPKKRGKCHEKAIHPHEYGSRVSIICPGSHGPTGVRSRIAIRK
jgi:hypothetical protein